MFTIKIDFKESMKNDPEIFTKGVITEEFESILEALDFSDSLTKEKRANESKDYKHTAKINTDEENNVWLEVKNYIQFGKYCYNKQHYTAAVLSDSEVLDFLGEDNLLSASVCPKIFIRQGGSWNISLKPDFVEFPKLNKRKSGKYFNTEIYAVKDGIKTKGKLVKREETNITHNFYYGLKSLTVWDISALIASQIPLLSKSLGFPNELLMAHKDENHNLYVSAGALKPSDREEYERQYRNACIQIAKGFEEGILGSSDPHILTWIKGIQKLIQDEKE